MLKLIKPYNKASSAAWVCDDDSIQPPHFFVSVCPAPYLLCPDGLLYPALVNLVDAQRHNNGFKIDNTLLPAAQILHGCPPKDGIPAINCR